MRHFIRWVFSYDAPPPVQMSLAVLVTLLGLVAFLLTFVGMAVGYYGTVAAIWIGGPLLVILIAYLAREDRE